MWYLPADLPADPPKLPEASPLFRSALERKFTLILRSCLGLIVLDFVFDDDHDFVQQSAHFRCRRFGEAMTALLSHESRSVAIDYVHWGLVSESPNLKFLYQKEADAKLLRESLV